MGAGLHINGGERTRLLGRKRLQHVRRSLERTKIRVEQASVPAEKSFFAVDSIFAGMDGNPQTEVCATEKP
jgi:hypothetical protein